MTDVVLGTKGLSKSYGQGEKLVKAVDKVNIQIQRGEFGAIVGKSGSGKSTLLHLLGGLDYPTAGEVWVEGDNIADFNEEQLAVFRRRKIGFVFQAYNLIASLNVWKILSYPCLLYTSIVCLGKEEACKRRGLCFPKPAHKSISNLG